MNQIQKNADDINSRLGMIENADMFKQPPALSGGLPRDAKDYFEYIEIHRAKTVETLSQKYRAIGPLLTKMEGLVVNTNTGKSTKLRSYYAYWEKRAFEALEKMVQNNLTTFNNQLQTKMLFSVDAMLSPPDIIVNPPYNELFKHLMQVDLSLFFRNICVVP